MVERFPTSQPNVPKPERQIFTSKDMLKQFVEEMYRFAEENGNVETEPGSRDRVGWIDTNMKPGEIQSRLQESSFRDLLLPESAFTEFGIDASDVSFARLRLRKRDWEKSRVENLRYVPYPGEFDWERGIAIKLRYTSQGYESRQIVSLTVREDGQNEQFEFRRSFDPPKDDPFFKVHSRIRHSNAIEDTRDFMNLVQDIYRQRIGTVGI